MRLIRTTLCLISLVLMLASLTVMIQTEQTTWGWDLSKEGTNWTYVYVRAGALCVAYVNSDSAPQLHSSSPLGWYTKDANDYAKFEMKKAMVRGRYARMIQQQKVLLARLKNISAT